MFLNTKIYIAPHILIVRDVKKHTLNNGQVTESEAKQKCIETQRKYEPNRFNNNQQNIHLKIKELHLLINS